MFFGSIVSARRKKPLAAAVSPRSNAAAPPATSLAALSSSSGPLLDGLSARAERGKPQVRVTANMRGITRNFSERNMITRLGQNERARETILSLSARVERSLVDQLQSKLDHERVIDIRLVDYTGLAEVSA